MKRVSKLMLVSAVALAVFVVGALPASAGNGGGGVSGTVALDQGLELLVPHHNIFTFNDTAIVGAFISNDGMGQFAGTVNVPTVHGATAGTEDTISGTGSVNSFSVVGSGTGSINSACAGTFTRVGGIVIVQLNCGGTGSNVSGHAYSGTVIVEALFVPDDGHNGVTDKVQHASFNGLYQVA